MILCGGAADEVYVEMKKKAKDAILALVEKERDGEQIDRTLLKNVLVRGPCRVAPVSGSSHLRGVLAPDSTEPRDGWSTCLL